MDQPYVRRDEGEPVTEASKVANAGLQAIDAALDGRQAYVLVIVGRLRPMPEDGIDSVTATHIEAPNRDEADRIAFDALRMALVRAGRQIGVKIDYDFRPMRPGRRETDDA